MKEQKKIKLTIPITDYLLESLKEIIPKDESVSIEEAITQALYFDSFCRQLQKSPVKLFKYSDKKRVESFKNEKKYDVFLPSNQYKDLKEIAAFEENISIEDVILIMIITKISAMRWAKNVFSPFHPYLSLPMEDIKKIGKND